MINCADAFKGQLPPSIGTFPGRTGTNNNGNGGLLFHLLPYIEQRALYVTSYCTNDPDGRNSPGTTYSQWTSPVNNSVISTYQCPSDPTNVQAVSRTSYVHNGQVFLRHYEPLWDSSNSLRFPVQIVDGTSSTVMFSEGTRLCVGGSYNDRYWPDWGGMGYSTQYGDPTGPGNPFGSNIFPLQGDAGSCNGGIPATPHTGGVIQTSMFDASVRSVSPGVSSNTWWAAWTPAGNEVIPNLQ